MNKLLALDCSTLHSILFEIFSHNDDQEKHQLSKVSQLFKLISEDDRLWKKRAIACGKESEPISNKEFVKIYTKEYIYLLLSILPSFTKLTSPDVFDAKWEVDCYFEQHIDFSPISLQIASVTNLRPLRMLLEAGISVRAITSSEVLGKALWNDQNDVPAGILKILLDSGVKPDFTCLASVLLAEKISQKAIQLILKAGLKPDRSHLHQTLEAFKPADPEEDFPLNLELHQALAAYRPSSEENSLDLEIEVDEEPLALETVQAFLDQGVSVSKDTLQLAEECQVSADVMNLLKTKYEADV